MADHSTIEWTDATWNPITGCTVHSAGCTNCYAMKLAGTRLQHHWSRKGLTRETKAGPVWTGEVRFNEEWLLQPLNWNRPRQIFVCAHADLFHEAVPDEWIDRIFAVIALAPQHSFQVLTKRSARMRAYFDSDSDRGKGVRAAYDGMGYSQVWLPEWPLPNVWLGVSVEDQRAADERIPDLLATRAAVRWLSCEPLLGPVEIDPCDLAALDWLVAGGESGAGARPMHPDWARSLRDQCAVAAGVPFHFKQWGSWLPYGSIDGDGNFNTRSRGERPGLWHEWPEGQGFSVNVGKKQAGRRLDGIEHNGVPA